MSRKEGHRKGTPTFCSRETCAAEFDISTATWDDWVKLGLLPKPYLFGRSGTTPRWDFDEVCAWIRERGKLQSSICTNEDDRHFNLSALRGGRDVKQGKAAARQT